MEHTFVERHIGPREADIGNMLSVCGVESLDDLISQALPASIRLPKALKLSSFPAPLGEHEALAMLKEKAGKNTVRRALLGMGFSGTRVPAVIQRNILENPGWYTQYTPYQAEISQGRLEALFNYQTLFANLTGLPMCNASLLDESSAAAEALAMCLAHAEKKALQDKAACFLVDSRVHPQTLGVLQTKAKALGVQLESLDIEKPNSIKENIGILIQYPASSGEVYALDTVITAVHACGGLVCMACDPLALVLLKSPGEWGADIVLGSSQRFGVPLGYGGPHAAFFAVQDELKRLMPGRLVGESKDAQGNPGLRLALQTREQHIRREKATSNICTAQVLLAVMASMYAVYHGPKGLRAIATRVHGQALRLSQALRKASWNVSEHFFDCLRIEGDEKKLAEISQKAGKQGYLFRSLEKSVLCVALDECTDEHELQNLAKLFSASLTKENTKDALTSTTLDLFSRQATVLPQAVFHRYHSETEMLRYIRRLEAKDLSLTASMIPLGSCTMKLNATSELYPVSWPEFANLHPFCPPEDAHGYAEMMHELQSALAEMTGFDAVSLQPNSGSMGEYAGLLAILGYHESRGEAHRRLCLIPRSAHGTNPASAAVAGLDVLVVECDEQGNIDKADLRAKAEAHAKELAALMITYPSTHGVFEEGVQEICELIHALGGQVYLDGANLNALVGLSSPAYIGADVCHLNLHKTFCIPHGGGGPGVGPIAARKHLAAFLPGHNVRPIAERSEGAVVAAPFGSASILPIPWMYIACMGAEGLTRATKVAILNANYIASRLKNHYAMVYAGKNGRVAHECIIDMRPFKASSGVEVEDIAKRLMDYGFHAPTVSWPVAGTLMIEPTESESLAELDRFCDAMIAIRKEIARIESGEWPKDVNPLKCAPHTAALVCADTWDRPYSRELAAFPSPSTKASKFWPSVSRIDAAYGDRNLVCACS